MSGGRGRRGRRGRRGSRRAEEQARAGERPATSPPPVPAEAGAKPDTGTEPDDAPDERAGAETRPADAAGEAAGGDAPSSARPISARELVARMEGRGAHPGEDAEDHPPPMRPVRRFRVDDQEWLARPEGEGWGGNGHVGLARLTVVRFYHPAEPETARREALLPVGRLEDLYDEELRTLLERARPVEPREPT